MTDVTALKKRIEESGLSVTYVAEKSGILRKTLYNRMRTVNIIHQSKGGGAKGEPSVYKNQRRYF